MSPEKASLVADISVPGLGVGQYISKLRCIDVPTVILVAKVTEKSQKSHRNPNLPSHNFLKTSECARVG